jgi:uncharacterized iron-regulated membrane protein
VFFPLVKKLHMYAGLFTFTALIVYGLSGLIDSSLPAWSERQAPPTTEQYVPFTTPVGVSDKQLADMVYAELDLPLSGPAAEYALRRDEEQNLVVSFYTANGVRTVTVLEAKGQLRVVRAQGSLSSFITGMHGAVLRYAAPRFLTQAWAYYNEAGLWALGFMALSGVVLWLGSRSRLIWARVVFAAGNGAFLLLYWLMR